MHTTAAVPETNAPWIDREEIVPDPNQPRKTFDPEELRALADSLQSAGQLQPARVRWDEMMRKYVLIDGEKRWRAAGIAGLAQIQCVFQEAPLTEAELRTQQLVANGQRSDIPDMERAKAYQDLKELLRCSDHDLAKRLGVHHTTVGRFLKLLKQAPEVQEKIRTGELSPSKLRGKQKAVGKPKVYVKAGVKVTVENKPSMLKRDIAAAVRAIADDIENQGRAKGAQSAAAA